MYWLIFLIVSLGTPPARANEVTRLLEAMQDPSWDTAFHAAHELYRQRAAGQHLDAIEELGKRLYTLDSYRWGQYAVLVDAVAVRTKKTHRGIARVLRGKIFADIQRGFVGAYDDCTEFAAQALVSIAPDDTLTLHALLKLRAAALYFGRVDAIPTTEAIFRETLERNWDRGNVEIREKLAGHTHCNQWLKKIGRLPAN
jgi:hypothetical protein